MNDIMLDVQNLTHHFKLNKKVSIKALDDVSFQLYKGEILGIVGESGSGKSTLARCIMNIYNPTSGRIQFEGIDTLNKVEYRKNKKYLQTQRQIIFQDSASSLDQRMKVMDIIAEPMRVNRIKSKHGTLRDEAAFQLKYVGMDASYLDKLPTELSGGQRQRVAIARALSMEPHLLIADEPIAALDVSIQAQIVNLFLHLREEHNVTMLFIAHDLSMVEFLCDRVAVMYQGKIVEIGKTKDVFGNPVHNYTKALLSAIPIPDPDYERQRKRIIFSDDQFILEGVMSEVEPEHFVLRKEAGNQCIII